MFGFSKHEKLAKSIDSVMNAWAAVQALDAGLSGSAGAPISGAAHAGFLWGVADSLGQARGFDLETTAKGLKHYLSRFSDGDEVFVLAATAPLNTDSAPWVDLAGKAVHAISTGKDPMQVLLPLAEKYRLGTV